MQLSLPMKVQVWRREHEHLPGLYRYKLYGNFQVDFIHICKIHVSGKFDNNLPPGCDSVGVFGRPARSDKVPTELGLKHSGLSAGGRGGSGGTTSSSASGPSLISSN